MLLLILVAQAVFTVVVMNAVSCRLIFRASKHYVQCCASSTATSYCTLHSCSHCRSTTTTILCLETNLTLAILSKCHTWASQCDVENAYTSFLP